MYLSISAFPDLPKTIADFRDPKHCENPVNEEYNHHVGDNEIPAKDEAQVQVMRHISPLLRG